MKKKLAIELDGKIAEIAAIMSNPDRPSNTLHERFEPLDPVILSETCAWVRFQKYDPQGHQTKLAGCFVYKCGPWQWVFPSESMILGMEVLWRLLIEIDSVNYLANFEQPEAAGESW